MGIYGQITPRPGEAHATPIPAAYRRDAGGRRSLIRANDSGEEDSIDGLWQSKMTGYSVDWGTRA